MTEARNSRLVKITYTSKTGDSAIGKKLFGYKSWNVKGDSKEYVHKPIVGSLQGLPILRIGRSRFIAPEEKLQVIQNAIKRKGGVVRRVEPVTMDEKTVERNARHAYRGLIDPLIEKMKYASETRDRQLYVASLENGMRMVGYFERFLNELDDYGSSFVKQEEHRGSEFIKRMQSFESIAKEDFEAAKLQTELFASELENLRDHILK